jgi:hypothetical protein
MDSRRHLRLGLALFAAVLHLALPVGAYAKASSAAEQRDFCSAARAGPADAGGRPLRLPASSDHHCAHAPCCASAAAFAAAPPPAAVGMLWIAPARFRAPSGEAVGARVAAIAAAQPRGPPPVR